MRRNLGLVGFFLLSIIGFAQEKTVTGGVTDLEGNPLSGVNVLILETSRGTQTDLNGYYSIEVMDGQILQFSYIGFKAKEVTVGLEDTINIVLEQSVSLLDDVVIIGYGEKTKRELTDNVVKVTSEDYADIPVPELFNKLAGKVAGVQIGQTNGKIEAGLVFKIRGQASISAGSAPLYVLDGIPLINTNEPTSTGAPTNPLISLSANEIESIEILKDASSAAIYGARGANGVVIITTKRGREGKTKFNVNFSNGVSEATNRLEMLNAAQYVELLLESAARSSDPDATEKVMMAFDKMSNNTWRNGTYDTDWQDYSLINGHVRDVDFSISGGDEKTTFFFSGAYNDTKGIVDGNELDRVSSRINLRHKFSDKFSTGMNIGYSRTNMDRVPRDGAWTNPIHAVDLPPIAPAFLNGEPFRNVLHKLNYLLDDKYSFYNTRIRRIIGKVFGEYKVIDGLKLNSDFAYDLYSQSEDQFRGSLAPFSFIDPGAFASNVDIENYIFSNYATFEKNINGKHDFNVVAGIELNKSNRRATGSRGVGFPSDEFQTIDGASSIIFGSGNKSAYAFLSYFARATYSFSNKYLFKASVRRDGSSRFGKATQYGTFPAFSAGWILSEEDFFNNSKVFSFLKLRASWGKVGNAEIGNFASLPLYGAVSYDQNPGIQPIQAGNRSLSWEESTQIDTALEYAILNNRIAGEFAYYIKDTDGLIFSQPLPPSSGNPNGSGITKNIGRLKSYGIEIIINTRNIETDDFSWTTNFNLGQNKSKIIDLPNGEDVIGRYNILREGEALDAFYLIEYAGVDPANGDALYYTNTDLGNGNFSRATTNNPNEANRRLIGQPFPDWIGGLTNTLTYNNFDLSFTFLGEWGASVWDIDATVYSSNANGLGNQTEDQLNRWQKPGDITNVPEARFGDRNGNASSTRYLFNADFIRLRNMILGYTLPDNLLNKEGFDAIRIYLSGINLLTITDFPGYDPGSTEDVVAFEASGVTAMSPPPARTYSLGVNISF